MDVNTNTPRQRTRGTTIDGIAVRPRMVRREPLAVTPSSNRRRTVGTRTPYVANTSRQATRQAAHPVVIAMNMALPGAPERPYQGTYYRKTVSKTGKRLMSGAAVGLSVLLVAGGILFTQGIFSAQKVFKGGAQATALQAVVNPNQLKGEGDGRVNVLLMGIGGPGHDGGDLTDSIVIASIDPVNKTASLVSIPRDLWVKVNGQSMKINGAYAAGKYKKLGGINSRSSDPKAIQEGLRVVDSTIESTMGIDIHYNVLLNFQAFRQAVDTVGGVPVHVPEDLYDRSMAWENKRNPIIAKAGLQEMDGKQALMYVRSRHTSSDFARSERQRAVILGLKQKTVSVGTLSNPVKISKLVSAFGNNVTTDFSVRDASRMYSIFSKIPDASVRSLDLASLEKPLVTTGRVGNQSVVLPKAGLNNYQAIQQFIRESLPDGYILKERAKVAVLNGSTVSGQAASIAAELKSYGYNIGRVGDAPTKGYESSVLVNLKGTKNKYTENYLEKRFGVEAVRSLPDGTIQKGDADFILILGNNETFSTED